MTSQPINSRAANDTVREQWNQAAKGWSDSSAVIRPWLREATQAMLGMAGIKAGSHVLDVAAGAGDQTLDIAERVGREGYVLANDLSPDILLLASHKAAEAGYQNVETRVSDGENLQVEDAKFDAVICRLGLMFFSDPLQGLREMMWAVKPGGGVCTMVFSTPDKTSLYYDFDVDGAQARRSAAARSVSTGRASQPGQVWIDRRTL